MPEIAGYDPAEENTSTTGNLIQKSSFRAAQFKCYFVSLQLKTDPFDCSVGRTEKELAAANKYRGLLAFTK